METIFIDKTNFEKSCRIADIDSNEVCGLMIGNNNYVNEIVIIKNQKPSPYYFEFTSSKASDIHLYAMKNGMKVIGVFHSHPQNMPSPSTTDFDWMKENPGIWTIYSPKYKDTKSWRRIEDQVIKIETKLANAYY